MRLDRSQRSHRTIIIAALLAVEGIFLSSFGIAVPELVTWPIFLGVYGVTLVLISLALIR